MARIKVEPRFGTLGALFTFCYGCNTPKYDVPINLKWVFPNTLTFHCRECDNIYEILIEKGDPIDFRLQKYKREIEVE